MQDGGLVPALRRRLDDAAAADGGWAYYAGKASRIEPTAWALLALGASASPADAQLEAALSFFRRIQQDSGLLVEAGVPGPNYGWNGLALLALNANADLAGTRWVRQLAAALGAVKGVQLRESDPAILRQNSQLQGWSWTQGTFSWIEPTAWNLLALKTSPMSDEAVGARISEAEALIADRACKPAGWNYGNSAVLMQDLRPYVSTTALALLAMQDRRDLPEVERGLAWLETEALSERSAMALALSAICLTVFGQPAEPILAELGRQAGQTAFLGNAHLEAMALYALTLDDHQARGFRVTRAT
jgi:hypothetical protein